MVGNVWRANQIYSRPGKPGKLPIGKTFFYSKIEPLLEKVRLGDHVVAYTDRSVVRIIEAGIAAAKENA